MLYQMWEGKERGIRNDSKVLAQVTKRVELPFCTMEKSRGGTSLEENIKGYALDI